MKIAVYGVSRSGKDYLLDRSVAYLNTQGISAVHIKGSATLNKLSNQEYGIPLKHADEEKRTVLRKHFIDIVEKTALVHDVVFVDGHYAFMGDDGFYTVFTDADKYCYDHFFYLDTLTEKIIEFSRANPKTPQDLSIQPDEIDAWKLFEIQGLSNACDALNKELVILDGQTQNCIQFLTQWIKNFSNQFDYPMIAKQLVEQFLENTQIKHQAVVLLDGDNTLAMNDATYDFCDFLNIDKSVLKQIFKGDRYSSYQFFQVQHLYRHLNNTQWEKAIQYAASKIKISDDVWAFSKKQNAYCCILTSGVLQLWQYQADRLGNIEQVWGNSIFGTPNFFVTPMLKKHIALAFQSYGIHVIAIGDSIIDIPMLEVAEQSYIVAHTKLNQVVSQYFSGSLHTKIQQIFVTKWCYPIRQLFEKGDLT
ncbi:haloacid dehalogenase-like hydrolase [Neisseria sp.]|uniref:haloacid dehalogenase-like hydrolase n=1 Tax=Neisseria sp. TaxID=192066 RepID=UPI00289FAEC7|nr:haloacid dehalogenase-like hydrolase [Neisseria sp.]